ncbi:hypothetical protein SteCoe_23501 [Stentor coeruleus]|uniref:DUF4709 domain-containing protein n=1 Tax=Stentor coeruleus TaxID=5963 RepID=A0A1R2BJW4_9CILI|nr:hypothetical protein SteCoe_23501 [Stentor coeruleus]
MENYDLSDSDAEFWAELDKQIILKDKVETIETKNNSEKTLEEKTQEFMKIAPSNYYRERLQQLVSQVRIATQAQFDTQFSKAKKLLIQEHTDAISKLKYLHRDQILALKKEFSNVESKLIEKDKAISYLQTCLIEQEKSLTSLRLNKDNKYSEEERVKEINSTMEANKLAFNMQISHMKELVEIYKKEADQAKYDLKVLQDYHDNKLDEFDQEKSALLDKIQKAKSESLKKIEEVSKNYETFKSDVEKELNIRFVIHKRQQNFIDYLKRELKTAKMIIETPRLNAKYLTKLNEKTTTLDYSIDIPRRPSKIQSLTKRSSIRNSSFSTSATPMYSNFSEIELNASLKFVGIPEDVNH